MKVAVSGGAGFIGSHVVELCISAGFEVVVLDNFSTGRKENLQHLSNKIELVECDLSVFSGWENRLEGCKWFIHLAALADIVPSIQNPETYFRSNVTGTLNYLTVARKYECERFIYSASSSCYGIPDIYPTPESVTISPQYPYALTKRMGEELVLHWSEIYGLPAVSLRFFNVYGTRSRTNSAYGAALGVFLKQKLENKPFTVIGDGKQKRDFIHVEDIIQANILVANLTKNHKGDIFNVGTGQAYTVNEIADMFGGNKKYGEKRIEPKNYKFNRPWGVPVRYHDFEEYNSKIRPDVFEFHLSYSDLELNIDQFLTGKYECGFVVHAGFVQGALWEIERCVREMDMKVLCLPTHFLNSAGKWQGIIDPSTEPIFELANEYSLAIEIHPYDGEKFIALENKI